jgi:hypothetical protein
MFASADHRHNSSASNSQVWVCPARGRICPWLHTSTPERRSRTLASRHAPQFAVSSARQPDSPRHSNTHTHFRPLMTTVGLEPTPFRTDALSQHPRPLGQTVLGAAKNHNATRSSLTIWGARKLVESASPSFWPPEPQMCKCVLRPARHAFARVRADHPNQV